ncbi:hypothetical protein BUZ16_09585 [Staphylococcus haemolyticus]|uniref:hypothetical protein n=1 Tax=Staphylococcus haemolyticus TaxID=1283 RepID=UPI000D1FC115|nr:hypothetical protein [Staphylococcus haemolyticus]PTK81842.1 hypothetical protein BUZ16_09585 [Staphylococcus haemolyticus]
MTKVVKSTLLNILLFLPYFLISIFFFFLVSYVDNNKNQINKLSHSIGLSELQMYIFISIFIIISSIISFAIIVFLVKLAHFLFAKNTYKNDSDLLFSVLLGLTISQFLGILLNMLFAFTSKEISITLTLFNIILIPTFYYYFSRKINLSIIIVFVMIIIAIPTIIFI